MFDARLPQGYFTSRPALKRYVRTSSAYLTAARQIAAAAALRALLPPPAAGGGADAAQRQQTQQPATLLGRVTSLLSGWLARGAATGPSAAVPHSRHRALISDPAALQLAETQPSETTASAAAAAASDPAPQQGDPLSVVSVSAPRGLDLLEDGLATAQHHDGVSGTSRQHVACDYARRLAAGWAAAHAATAPALAALTGAGDGDATAAAGGGFAQCHLLNVSVCKPTEKVPPGGSVSVLLWNSLGWSRVEPVRIPVVAHDLSVTDSSGNAVGSQVRLDACCPGRVGGGAACLASYQTAKYEHREH